MPLMYRAQTLYMSFCLDCHRQPEKYVRPRSEVFNPNYETPANQLELGKKLVAEYKIQNTQHLQSCSTCHR
jgi:cytochrome c peroxidase